MGKTRGSMCEQGGLQRNKHMGNYLTWSFTFFKLSTVNKMSGIEFQWQYLVKSKPKFLWYQMIYCNAGICFLKHDLMLSFVALCPVRVLDEASWAPKVRRKSWRPSGTGDCRYLAPSGGHTPSASCSGSCLKEDSCKSWAPVRPPPCCCYSHHMSPIQVRPVCHLWWLPDATPGAVRPVAVPKPSGLFHLTADREDGLHHFHGHLIIHLHGPEHGRAGLSGGQGCHEVDVLISQSGD